MHLFRMSNGRWIKWTFLINSVAFISKSHYKSVIVYAFWTVKLYDSLEQFATLHVNDVLSLRIRMESFL